jgi:HD-GYP domain-containing protein (c-di-GMP phosphodiesterase class II)
VAHVLGLDATAERTILLGAYLHDVGMVRVPHEILHKAAPLSLEERAVVERHTVWGIGVLADVDFPWDLKPIIRSHHERYDGSGYPDHLVGEAIPLGAQIVGILDVYDALTSARAHQSAMQPAEALAEITRCRSQWSEHVLDAFTQVVTQPSRPESPAGSIGWSLLTG